MAFQAGSIFAEIELDASPLVKGLKDASKAMNDFARNVQSRIGPSTIRPFDRLRKSIATVGRSFSLLAKIATKAFGIIRVAVRIVLTPFRLLQGFLTKSIFNLKNLIIVIAAAAFVRRAKEVESISIAFTNLSEGLGLVASEFLPALRESLKGTVSDLELMRTTNNAMLLGVVQSKEQFAELAVVARRLGRAVGRDAVDALNDLAVGIGRQSRLILDNLGIVISVQKAYDTFAARLGKTADELTDTQKRQAFLTAVMEQSRRKLKSLGPDVLTVADQWDRLTASINNTINALATSLVGGNLPSAIADFIDENLQRIVASAVAAEVAIGRTIKDIISLFRDALASGEIARLLIELFRSFVSIVFASIVELVKLIVPVVITAVKEALDATDDILDAAARRRAAESRRRILLDRIGQRQLDILQPGIGSGGRGPVTSRDRAEAALSESDLQARKDAILKAFPDLAKPIDEQAEAIESALGRIFDKILTKFKDIQAAISGESEKAQKKSFTDSEIIVLGFKARADVITKILKRQFDVLGKASPLRAFQIIASDPIFNFRPIVTREVIQPIANAINFLEAFSKELGIRRPDLFTVDQIVQGRRLIGLFADATNEVNKTINALKKLTTPETIDPEKFAEILKPFTEQAKKLQLQLDTLGLSARKATEVEFKSRTAGQPQLTDIQEDELKAAILLAKTTAIRLKAGKELQAISKAILETRIKIAEVTKNVAEFARLRLERTKELSVAENVIRFLAEFVLKLEEKKLDVAKEIVALKNDLLVVEDDIAIIGKTNEQAARTLVERARERGEIVKKEVADQLILLGIAEDRRDVADQLNADQVKFEDELESTAQNILATRIKIAEVSGNLVGLARLRLEQTKNLSLVDKVRLAILKAIEFLANKRLATETKLSGLKSSIRDIEGQIATVGKTHEETARILIDRARARGELISEEIAKQRILLGIEEDKLDKAKEIDKKREELVGSVTDIIGQGVTEGILKGKIAFKDVAEIGANLFRNFMSKAIDDIGKKLSDILTKVLGSAGAIGLAGALIGIGGLIISNLQGKTESTIDDFGNQVTSSEAVRGVVAGPTNVAISRVGNQLKEALRVSEGLLLRIANAVESGGGGGGGGAGDTSDNLSVLLSGSTPS